ncbi:LuxR family transcriptional regulator [Nocardioides sp. Root190]|uniref:response regulator n=1 Tax=Nocardioides sp. Root190 TaxID=1736488 RepID=UPI0006F5641C|nr:response regulator transcription factor [Nocardioides sp. Root190]KRB80537.1 LuxR family transcriptional regulator [Nocardioides sp. Root190]
MQPDPIRVVVADDQPAICSGFAALLAAQDGVEVVGTAGDGRELVALVGRTRPDVALVDVRMPELDGIEAKRLITDDHSTRVLILTTFDLDAYVYDAVRAGASGFLLKDVTAERLVEAVRLVAEGAVLLAPAVSRQLVAARFADVPGARPEPASAATLSPREREVLLQLAKGRSNAEIATDLHIAAETVKSHVAEVLRKLGLRDRIQAVVYAYEHGLVGR